MRKPQAFDQLCYNMNTGKEFPLHILPDVNFLVSEKQVTFGEHTRPHRINFYAIVWFTEDGGEHFIDFVAYQIKKDRIYLLAQNQIHSVPADAVPKARIIVFSHAFFLSIEDYQLRQLFLPFENQGIDVPLHKVENLQMLFGIILQEYSSYNNYKLLFQYTSAFLTNLGRLAKQQLPAVVGSDIRLVKVLQLIHDHFRTNKQASFYAGEIGLTPKRINEILRQKAGTSISQLINQLLLVEGKRALFAGLHTIKEIAYDLGFSDQSYFSRFFRKHTGMSPEQIREQYLKEEVLL